jgi:hypothetical protein
LISSSPLRAPTGLTKSKSRGSWICESELPKAAEPSIKPADVGMGANKIKVQNTKNDFFIV